MRSQLTRTGRSLEAGAHILDEKIPLTTESPIYTEMGIQVSADLLVYHRLYFCLQQKVNLTPIMEC